jgi:hypothetical protein
MEEIYADHILYLSYSHDVHRIVVEKFLRGETVVGAKVYICDLEEE